MSVTLHVIGLPHTEVQALYSTCAFTGKILRFSRMMQRYGWQVYEYSNGRSESGCTRHIPVLSSDELRALSRRNQTDTAELYDVDIANVELQREFYTRLIALLKQHAKAGDIICHVFGPLRIVSDALPLCVNVESGIGYSAADDSVVLPYRIFESSAWMHWHYGRRSMTDGHNYHFVVPNYYDIDAWRVQLQPMQPSYVLFFGRILPTKGLHVIVEIAKRMPQQLFILCGQGDHTHWTTQSPNLQYMAPVLGNDRAPLLAGATAMLCPSMFIEPFCGSAVEAQLCGTPVVSVPYGAFLETVEHRRTGFHCSTLRDFTDALSTGVQTLDRAYIASRARHLYSMETVGLQYDEAFRKLAALTDKDKGWYS